MMKFDPTVVRKYRIAEILEYLTNREYLFVMNVLPGVLGVSPNTLRNYIYLKESSPTDIPYQKVVAMERFFGIKEGHLANVKPWGKNFRELQRLSKKTKK